jgi:acyl carrier protein
MSSGLNTSAASVPSLEDVVAALKQSLAETEGFHRAAGNIDENVPMLEGGLDLDSVTVVELISRIEVRLHFQFLDADLRTRSFESLRVLAQVILRTLASAVGPS